MSTAARHQYVERLVRSGCSIRLPMLLERGGPKPIHRVRDRQGVSVVAVRTAALAAAERDALLRFRFAQYLDVGFVDADVAHRQRLAREPSTPGDSRSVDCMALSSRDGRLLAALSLRAPAPAPAGTTLRTRKRPLLPLEEHFGWGALNRLHLLPDLPLERIRELGRFVRNQRLGALSDLGTRAVVEVCVAAFHCLTGPLRLEVEAFAGEFEDAVARKHLEFLHTPFVMVRGGLPAFAPGHFLNPALDARARYPFAGLVSDLGSMSDRLRAIETALAEPGLAALAALASADGAPARSSVLPADGVACLADTPLPQRRLAGEDRRRARLLGARLRAFRPFAGLSDTECTTLHSLLEQVRIDAGATVVARGEPADALYLITDGRARVMGTRASATLGPGDWFGEIGLLTRGERTADVVAASPLRLLKVPAGTYRRMLQALPDVDGELTRVALLRAASQLEAA